MNKRLPFLIVIAFLSVNMFGEVMYPNATFKQFPTEEMMNETGGTQVIGMSRNGKYIIGGTYVAGGFIYDVENDKMIMVGGSAITDDGTVAGGLLTYNINTGERRVLERNYAYDFMMTTGISNDGRIVTGCGGPDWTQLHPLYWEDGVLHELPFPSTAQVGNFKVNGCRANGVSDDGSVIFGYFIANPNTNPMIIWERQADGSYEYVNVWENMYEPNHHWVYDYDKKEYEFVRGDNPYCWYEPMVISGNGEIILMRIQENTENVSPPSQVGYYHVKSRELKIAPYNKNNIVGDAGNFIINMIADDGTAAGITQIINLSDAIPFVMPYMGEPIFLNEMFPQFDRLDYYLDAKETKGGLPYLCTVISRDGRFIGGYSTDIITYTRDGQFGQDLGFWGYVIDRDASLGNPWTNQDTQVEQIETEENLTEEYYTLTGIRVQNPEHGIYIVRTSDGKSRKVVL